MGVNSERFHLVIRGFKKKLSGQYMNNYYILYMYMHTHTYKHTYIHIYIYIERYMYPSFTKE